MSGKGKRSADSLEESVKTSHPPQGRKNLAAQSETASSSSKSDNNSGLDERPKATKCPRNGRPPATKTPQKAPRYSVASLPNSLFFSSLSEELQSSSTTSSLVRSSSSTTIPPQEATAPSKRTHLVTEEVVCSAKSILDNKYANKEKTKHSWNVDGALLISGFINSLHRKPRSKLYLIPHAGNRFRIFGELSDVNAFTTQLNDWVNDYFKMGRKLFYVEDNRISTKIFIKEKDFKDLAYRLEIATLFNLFDSNAFLTLFAMRIINNKNVEKNFSYLFHFIFDQNWEKAIKKNYKNINVHLTEEREKFSYCFFIHDSYENWKEAHTKFYGKNKINHTEFRYFAQLYQRLETVLKLPKVDFCRLENEMIDAIPVFAP
ncbi:MULTISPECIES: hypothetical protein [Legionella]|uniref:Uncharacterized protein n=1 Tax=Legionella maceachernii TaxID=466 RepID=A0A0W0VZQ9_9GAMM|nr:hypothetical protein [Legionella maceachernii]KTD25611.1 hypothetical protein Lmac_1975 [Legionella maceachernii]SJZ57457.1 hypothetical protein SAMN02745128_00465 [Legionella maceachernii]SUP00600.1 Uncharacterised protein [Legionella maceachernii]